MTPQILVAGIGNVFRADDGFGVEVVRRLFEREHQDGVQIVDFGIRGLDFAYTLLDNYYDAAIIVDIVSRGGPPGSLYVIEPETGCARVGPENATPSPFIDPHSMDPFTVLHWVKFMGGKLKFIRLVGCEPQTIASEYDLEMGLSTPVSQVIDKAVKLVEALIEDLARTSVACTN